MIDNHNYYRYDSNYNNSSSSPSEYGSSSGDSSLSDDDDADDDDDDDENSWSACTSSSSSCSSSSSATTTSTSSSYHNKVRMTYTTGSRSSTNNKTTDEFDEFCKSLERNDPYSTIVDTEQLQPQLMGNNNTNNNNRLLQLGQALRYNNRVKRITLHIDGIVNAIIQQQQQEKCDTNTSNVCKNNNNNDANNSLENQWMRPLYLFLLYNPSLRYVKMKNGVSSSMSMRIVNCALQVITENPAIQTLVLECMNVPIDALIQLLSRNSSSSSSSKSTLRTLEMDLCTIIIPPNNNNNTTNNNNNTTNNNNSQNNHTVLLQEQLAYAFGQNKTLRYLKLYRLEDDGLFLNSIFTQLRSNNQLKSLSVSLCGVDIILGLEESISTVRLPVRSSSSSSYYSWSNALGNVLLPSDPKKLCELKFHSMYFDETSFGTVARGIRNNRHITKIAFEYCRFDHNNNNNNNNNISNINNNNQHRYHDNDHGHRNHSISGGSPMISQYFYDMFCFLDSNNSTRKLFSSNFSKPRCSREVIIRQNSKFTYGNPLLIALPSIVGNPKSILTKLSITSISEKDFVRLFHSLSCCSPNTQSLSLRTLIYEYNTLDRESNTDTIRCQTLIDTIPKIRYLQVLKVGLGIGICQHLSQQLLESFERNCSLRTMEILYLGARPFFNLQPERTKLLQFYEKRNTYLPNVLQQVILVRSNPLGTNTNATTTVPLGLISKILEITLKWEIGTSQVFHTLLNLN